MHTRIMQGGRVLAVGLTLIWSAACGGDNPDTTGTPSSQIAANGHAGTGGIVTTGLAVTRLPRHGDTSHVGHRTALLGTLDGEDEIRDRDGRDDADDGHNHQQFN